MMTTFKLLNVFCILIIAISFGLCLSDQCKDGWMTYNDKCIKPLKRMASELEASKIDEKYDRFQINHLFIGNYSELEQRDTFICEKIKQSIEADWTGPLDSAIHQKLIQTLKFVVKKQLERNSSNFKLLVFATILSAIFLIWFNSGLNKMAQIKERLTYVEAIIPSQSREIRQIDYKITNELTHLTDKLRNGLISVSVPIGFVYVQFAGQSEPRVFWPNTDWANITDKYSGLFFRVDGGKSSEFGKTQEQSTATLEFYSYSCGDQLIGNSFGTDWERGVFGEPVNWHAIYKPDSCLCTGSYSYNTSDHVGFKFRLGNEETRPQNQAIRVWQRTQ